MRVVHVIARLNIGGAAVQAINLASTLPAYGCEVRLVRGVEEPDEGTMDDLAAELGVAPTLVPALRRNPGAHDLRALYDILGILWRTRPDVVHTHAAKAGTIGRVAVLLLPRRRRPAVIHTFHGHSLSGYFPSRTTAVYRAIERWLARRTTRLIAVSAEVRDELLALGVGSPDRFLVLPVGLDLKPFVAAGTAPRGERLAPRDALGVAPDAPLVTIVARMAPIKRVDRFLRVAARLAETVPEARFAVVGDGELREELRASHEARGLADRLSWTGYRRDVAALCAASDVVVLTSDNEGTPVSLIEAQAAGVPVVTTDVGGARSVVLDGVSGFVVGRDDEAGFASSIAEVLADRGNAEAMGRAGREHVLREFSLDRLASELSTLYREILQGSAAGMAR